VQDIQHSVEDHHVSEGVEEESHLDQDVINELSVSMENVDQL